MKDSFNGFGVQKSAFGTKVSDLIDGSQAGSVPSPLFFDVFAHVDVLLLMLKMIFWKASGTAK